jgi:phage terminase small subunit
MTEPARSARRPRRFPPHVTSDTPLTPRERLFVAEYLVDLHGADAAIRVGYAARSATVTASRLLRKANVQAAVQTAFAARLQRTEIKADDVLFHLAKSRMSTFRTSGCCSMRRDT